LEGQVAARSSGRDTLGSSSVTDPRRDSSLISSLNRLSCGFVTSTLAVIRFYIVNDESLHDGSDEFCPLVADTYTALCIRTSRLHVLIEDAVEGGERLVLRVSILIEEVGQLYFFKML
jgi:hypothetical protein